jgi:outer membrane biosynthesis protein TonB
MNSSRIVLIALWTLLLAGLASSTATAAELPRRTVSAPRATEVDEPRAPHPAPIRPTTLSAEAVRAGLRMQMGRVRACYERALKGEPGLAGRLVVSFEIRPDGSVRDAVLEVDGLGRTSVSRCVLRTVEDLRFGTSKSGLDVQYPFVFRPGW